MSAHRLTGVTGSSVKTLPLPFFLGIVGEYVGSMYTQVLKRPRVVEKERINF